MNLIRITRGRIEYPVTVEEKTNAPWTDDVTRRTWYTKCAFHPWNLIMMGERKFIGISAGNWKQRMCSHRNYFSNPPFRNQTAVSKYFWNLKHQGSNGNKGVLRIPQRSSITGISPTDCYVVYVGHLLAGDFTPLQRCSRCFLQPQQKKSK